MKSKTILGADGATKMRQITVGIHGKGGEAGIKAIQQLAGIENSKPHKDGLLFRICQYVEFKQKARRENEKL